jgi:hypothetical protein
MRNFLHMASLAPSIFLNKKQIPFINLNQKGKMHFVIMLLYSLEEKTTLY